MMQNLAAAARFTLLAIILLWRGSPASAQVCGSDYVVKDGDTLASIAQRVYGGRNQWTAIYYSNQDRLGANATLLVPGLTIAIPCVRGASPGGAPVPFTPSPAYRPAAAPPGSQDVPRARQILVLTADGFPPFAGSGLPKGGIMLDVLEASMDRLKQEGAGAFDVRVAWVNDRAGHLNPLLITLAFDVGLPWVKPDCGHPAGLDGDGQYLCENFLFSDPIHQSHSVLFVRQNAPITVNTDEELIGKTLCLAKGWSRFDLDKEGRGRLKGGKVTLMQRQTPEDCFRSLASGEADAVVMPQFTGAAIASAMGLSGRIRTAERPPHIETMHAVIAKTHPDAGAILNAINGALAKLKRSEYDRIVEKHLEPFGQARDGAALDAKSAGTARPPG